MKTVQFEQRLPQLRVSDDLHKRLEAVCLAQNMSMADVRRAALEEYVQPTAVLAIPIVGQIITGDDGDNKIEYFEEAA